MVKFKLNAVNFVLLSPAELGAKSTRRYFEPEPGREELGSMFIPSKKLERAVRRARLCVCSESDLAIIVRSPQHLPQRSFAIPCEDIVWGENDIQVSITGSEVTMNHLRRPENFEGQRLIFDDDVWLLREGSS